MGIPLWDRLDCKILRLNTITDQDFCSSTLLNQQCILDQTLWDHLYITDLAAIFLDGTDFKPIRTCNWSVAHEHCSLNSDQCSGYDPKFTLNGVLIMNHQNWISELKLKQFKKIAFFCFGKWLLDSRILRDRRTAWTPNGCTGLQI